MFSIFCTEPLAGDSPGSDVLATDPVPLWYTHAAEYVEAVNDATGIWAVPP